MRHLSRHADALTQCRMRVNSLADVLHILLAKALPQRRNGTHGLGIGCAQLNADDGDGVGQCCEMLGELRSGHGVLFLMRLNMACSLETAV